MKRIYTRKQIEEAIKYWTNELQLLEKSNSIKVIDELEKVFGEQLYSNDSFKVLDKNQLRIIFDILNRYLFNNQLPTIEIQYLTTEQIQSLFSKYNHNRNVDELYAVYFPIPDWSKVNFSKKCQIPSIHYLIINSSNEMNLSFLINSICHEMIHYLDVIKGDILFKMLSAYKTKTIADDEHLTDIFQKKMNIFNKNGMTIIPNGNDEDISSLNKLSSMRMKKTHSLNELEEIISESTFDYNHNALDLVSISDGELYSIAF